MQINKLELKNIKYFASGSEETPCYNADIFINGNLKRIWLRSLSVSINLKKNFMLTIKKAIRIFSSRHIWSRTIHKIRA
mgnify:CR=1 FL=1